MPAVKVDPDKVHEFEGPRQFEEWLARNHDAEREVWIKVHKVASGLKSITPKQAIDVALCWGWIDAIRKSFDERSFLQRYTRRNPKSIWSKINVANVERLTAEGRMTPHGLAEVETAKADGRWDRAYGSGKDMQVPPELQRAIDADPEAHATFERLSAQNRFALAFRIHNLKTEAGREKKIGQFIEMLRRGETIYPQGKS